MLPAGGNAARKVGDGFGQIIDLASDGTNVFVADAGRGAIYLLADATSAAPKPRKKLANARGITTLIVAGGSVFYGSQLVENRKAAGVIASIALPR
jgi:hypothetical protein